jgi:hypothetical protein
MSFRSYAYVNCCSASGITSFTHEFTYDSRYIDVIGSNQHQPQYHVKYPKSGIWYIRCFRERYGVSVGVTPIYDMGFRWSLKYGWRFWELFWPAGGGFTGDNEFLLSGIGVVDRWGPFCTMPADD